jgi:hypothetical protein
MLFGGRMPSGASKASDGTGVAVGPEAAVGVGVGVGVGEIGVPLADSGTDGVAAVDSDGGWLSWAAGAAQPASIMAATRTHTLRRIRARSLA